MEKTNIHQWIVRIIETCNNDFHFESVDKLIELFFDRFKDDELTLELRILRKQKWDDIHNILN